MMHDLLSATASLKLIDPKKIPPKSSSNLEDSFGFSLSNLASF